jgi:hypothetical protein
MENSSSQFRKTVSNTHREACEILSISRKKILELLNAKSQVKQYKTYVFCIFSHFAKSNCLLSDMLALTNHQMANRLEIEFFHILIMTV